MIVRPRCVRPRGAVTSGTAVLLGAAVLGLAASACGIPEDDKPQPIAQALPAPVVEPASTTSSRPAAQTRSAALYLVHETTSSGDPDILERVTVLVTVPADADGFPRAVLDQLADGATADQIASGLRSDIPPTVQVLDARRGDPSSVLVINLTDLGSVEGPKQRIAVAQFVFTATALDGIRAVRFLVDGKPTAIPVEQGAADAGAAITRDEFPTMKRALSEESETGSSTSSSSTSSSTTSTTSAVPTTTTSARIGGSTTSTPNSSTSSTTTPGSTPPSTGGTAESTTTTIS